MVNDKDFEDRETGLRPSIAELGSFHFDSLLVRLIAAALLLLHVYQGE